MVRIGCKSLIRLSVILLTVPSIALAQVANSSHAVPPTQGALKKLLFKSMIKEMGVSEDSEVASRLNEVLTQKKSPTHDFKPPVDSVIYRYDSDSGVRHTKPDHSQMIEQFKAHRNAVKERLIAKKEELQANPRPVAPKAMAKLRAMFVPKAIGKCEEASTKRYPLKDLKKGYNSSLLSSLNSSKDKKQKKKQLRDAQFIDILILPEDSPDDLLQTSDAPEKFFGHSTMVKRFSTEAGDSLSLQANRAGIKCLPYRVRIKGDKKFIHYGKDALMNYDAKKPEYHPQVKRRLYEFH